MPNISELQIEGRLQLDLEDTSKRIEYEFADWLLPAPKGIYVINKVEPVMVDGGEYYTVDVDKGNRIIRTPVTDITDVKLGVFTNTVGSDKISLGSDKQIIPKAFMLNKSKYVSSLPILPYRGITIVRGLINNQINNFIKYRKSGRTDSTIIKNNLIKLKREEWVTAVSRINELYEDIHTTIRLFMGMHDWHLYFVKLDETKALIEKSIDYRALQWIQYEEEKKEKRNGG